MATNYFVQLIKGYCAAGDLTGFALAFLVPFIAIVEICCVFLALAILAKLLIPAGGHKEAAEPSPWPLALLCVYLERYILLEEWGLGQPAKAFLAPQLVAIILWAVNSMYNDFNSAEFFAFFDRLTEKIGKLKWKHICKFLVMCIFSIPRWIRYLLRKVYSKKFPRFWAGALAFTILISLTVIFKITDLKSLSIAILIILFATELLLGLQSFGWFAFAWVLLLVIAGIMIEGADTSLEHIRSFYRGSLILCLIYADLANYDTAKLATGVLNTMTTLAVFIVNILVGALGGEGVADYQFKMNLILMPFVGIGYLAEILKDAQVYWERHHLPKDTPGICRIEDWIFKPETEEEEEKQTTDYEQRIQSLELKLRALEDELEQLRPRPKLKTRENPGRQT